MFKKTGIEEAEEILKWKYPNIYSYYNIEEQEKEYIYGTNYYNSFDEKGVEGFFCTDYEATIDTECEFTYDDEYLDIGFGLRPDLCGKGLGGRYVRSIMDFLKRERGYEKFRLTVARFNTRAIKVYEKIGFRAVKNVKSKYDGKEFTIMVFNKES